jgi:cation transport regulator ChaC
VREAVFAYGSLVAPDSLERTLGRAVATVGPATLRGWKRRWSQCRDNLRCEKTFAIESGGAVPPFVLGLNVEPDGLPEEAPNGVLIEIAGDELERLDERELRYDRVDVTENAESEQGFDRVWTYTAKSEHHAPDPPDGAVIIAAYAGTVDRAFRALGESELERYVETTGPPPVEIVEARLLREHIPAGNPRNW